MEEMGITEEQPTCAFCHCPFPDSDALPCGHYLCSNCIEDSQAKGRLDCPVCANPLVSEPRPDGASQPEEAAASALMAKLPLPGGEPQVVSVGAPVAKLPSDLIERQCREHKEPLEFYCEDDGECVCGPCTITGKHKTHSLLSLEKAAAEIKMQINRLQGNISKKFSEWRKNLEEDEENVLKMIDEEGVRLTAQSSYCSKTLNEKMDLIKLIDDEAQSLTQGDRLSFFQKSKQLLSKARELQDQKPLSNQRDMLNIRAISEQVKVLIDKSMAYYSIILNMIGEWARLTLDTKTAYWFLTVSEDARSLTFGYDLQPYPSNPERFRTHRQILCCQSFTSGYHSWAVQAEGIAWGIGIAYGSIAREGENSDLTNSNKAWCIHLNHGTLAASHNGLHTDIIKEPLHNKFQVELDYESGYVSFYQVKATVYSLLDELRAKIMNAVQIIPQQMEVVFNKAYK
ncbi:E3 ubiquitin-protein ligase TRIM7-like [Hemiscyllium ocellatum]|uniref:E3 ubiquitin-protein ligase TRIM7-like n=1 Tax=Hemiscyllium ocellatum TaxID=170820 RepID=UPI00296643E7|nr:E3 ubiquitin-protein ligase TRIM7-like [Hemiscyllium ocellatum]